MNYCQKMLSEVRSVSYSLALLVMLNDLPPPPPPPPQSHTQSGKTSTTNSTKAHLHSDLRMPVLQLQIGDQTCATAASFRGSSSSVTVYSQSCGHKMMLPTCAEWCVMTSICAVAASFRGSSSATTGRRTPSRSSELMYAAARRCCA